MKKLIVIAAAAFIGIAASAQSVKYAHVNYDELVALSPAADSARVVLQKAQKDAMEELQMMQEEAQNKYQQYQQKASTWTASVRESKERELQEMSSRIQDFQQSAQADLQQLQNNKMAPIYQKAREVVNDLAKKGGYIYVFDVNSILYIDAKQSVDLTPEARKVMGIPAGRTLESLQAELQAQAQTMQQ